MLLSNCSTKSETHPEPGPARLLGGLVLAVFSAVLSAIWLVWLPQLAQDPQVQAEMQAREEQGIDAAAMFYSDLPAVDNAEDRLEQLKVKDPALFWSP